MMYFLSICEQRENGDGPFVGAVFLNCPSETEAAEQAGQLVVAALPGCAPILEIVALPVPAGARPIPAAAYGKLLSRTEMERLFERVDFTPPLLPRPS
jgi:hypothetical protein